MDEVRLKVLVSFCQHTRVEGFSSRNFVFLFLEILSAAIHFKKDINQPTDNIWTTVYINLINIFRIRLESLVFCVLLLRV